MNIKFIGVAAVFFIISCSGNSDKEVVPSPGEDLGAGCTEEKLQEIKTVFYSCSQNLEIKKNNDICLKQAQDLKVKLKGVNCYFKLNGGKVDINENKVQELFLDKNNGKEDLEGAEEDDPFFQ